MVFLEIASPAAVDDRVVSQVYCILIQQCAAVLVSYCRPQVLVVVSVISARGRRRVWDSGEAKGAAPGCRKQKHAG